MNRDDTIHSIIDPDSAELKESKELLRDLRQMRDQARAQLEAGEGDDVAETERRLVNLEQRCREAEADVCRLRAPLLETRISIYGALLEISQHELQRCHEKLKVPRVA